MDNLDELELQIENDKDVGGNKEGKKKEISKMRIEDKIISKVIAKETH
jgi:hypothetical protein